MKTLDRPLLTAVALLGFGRLARLRRSISASSG
jgi:hypothetical protein